MNIDITKVSELLNNIGVTKDNMSGFSDCLLDILEELYDLETEIIKIMK